MTTSISQADALISNAPCRDSSVPTALWTPETTPKGLILACHGGSGHKFSPAIIAIVNQFIPRGWAVLAIDGPVHGDRSTDGKIDPSTAKIRFREAWRAGVGRTSMADDMQAALDKYLSTPTFAKLPVGYIGVSMGTAYGIPLLANEKRIEAAAIGLWGTTYPASEHLSEHAGHITCPVWFTQQWDDEFFDREGTFQLFDAIGTDNKRLVAYPGLHKELEGQRLADAVGFLCRTLEGTSAEGL